MKNLPIDVLRSFVTVADFGSFTQASELLARSQPAISMQLKKLEKLVEHPLFQRSDQKLNLTEDGQVLFEYARQILSLNDEAISTPCSIGRRATLSPVRAVSANPPKYKTVKPLLPSR